MRRHLFFISLLLVGCSGNGGDGFVDPGAQPAQVSHEPELTGLTLSPDSADYMEGNGSLVVTAEVTFRDTGLDLQTLWVRMPDGTSIAFVESQATSAGTFTENFVMSTEKIGAFTVELWLTDEAGDSSIHRAVDFDVIGNIQSSDWTQRLSGLPYSLNDIVWDGDAFIAVGDSGAVLTSADGIDWIAGASATNADLNAVAAYGPDIFAVGHDIVLRSTDHGQTWLTSATPNSIDLSAVAINSSQVVVGGFSYGLAASIIMISEDRGDTWTAVDSWPAQAYFFTDIVYRDGLFVASTDSSIMSNGARIKVSSDGKSWNEIIVRDDTAGLYAVVHDGTRFIVTGSYNTVFTSFDGFNWTERQTPVEDVDYLGAAWNGSRLVIAGGISWWYWWGGTIPAFERPIGLASTDGGESWEIFNIDGYFESRGIAWGNGRFVSVGQSTPISGEGAIYTAE